MLHLVCKWTVSLLMLFFLTLQAVQAHTTSDANFLQPDYFDDWKTLETPHFRIHHEASQQQLAQRMARIAEQVHQRLTPWFKWQPEDKTEVVMLDSVDFSNGGASPIPYNQFFVYMPSPVEGTLVDQLPWLEMVFTHEYVHVLQLDMVLGVPQTLRDIFGRVSDSIFTFAFFPQIFSPSWVTEGIAVYGESDNLDGYGRLNGAWYEAQMRMEVQRGLRSLSEESYEGYNGSRWPYGQIYLYGAWFFKYIESQYGVERLRHYFRVYGSNLIPWRMDNRSQRVFGKSAAVVWQDYQQWLKQRFEPQLAQIRARGDAGTRLLYDAPYFNQSITAAGNGDVYFLHNDSASTTRIQRLDAQGQTQTLFELTGVRSLDWHDQAGLLVMRNVVCENNKLYTDLYQWQAQEDELTRLTYCGRYVRAAWRPDGKAIAAVQLLQGRSKLVLLDAQGKQPQLLDHLAQGDVLGHLAWAPDGGSLVVAVKREKTGWNIERFDLVTHQWQALSWNEDREIRPRFSQDGKSVYFISDHDKVWNLRRLDLASGEVQTLSNSVSAIEEAVAMPDGSFRLVEYSAGGQTLVALDVPPALGRYAAHQAQAPHVNAITTQADYQPWAYDKVSDYSALDSVYPRSWFPVFFITDDESSFAGISLRGSDVLGFHRWVASPLYYYDVSELGGYAAYSFNDRLTLSVQRQFDTQGAAEDATRYLDDEQRYQLLLNHYFNSVDSSWYLAAGVVREKIISEVVKGTGVNITTRDTISGMIVRYDNTEFYLHGISPENGRRILISAESYDPLGNSNHSGDAYRLDWSDYFSLGGGHVLKLRTLTAGGDNTIRPYRLGGEYDERSDISGQTGIGQRKFALRGYSNDRLELRGTKLALLSAEWRIPLGLIYDGWFVPPLGVGRNSLSLFVDYGDAWFENQSAKYYTGAGLEWHVEALIGYNLLPLQTTLGYAHGFDDLIGEDRLYFQVGLPF